MIRLIGNSSLSHDTQSLVQIQVDAVEHSSPSPRFLPFSYLFNRVGISNYSDSIRDGRVNEERLKREREREREKRKKRKKGRKKGRGE